ncbi:MAG: hypothetical protein AAF141_00160 [Pseudomonadota bacterium]
MGTPAEDISSVASASQSRLGQIWSAGVAQARRPFKRHGNWACLAFAAGVAAITSSLSVTFFAFCVGYWLAVCD